MIDTHAHLHDRRILPRIDEVLADAKAAGVSDFITVACCKETSVASVDLANRYGLYATVGCHPQDANEYDVESETLYTELAKDKRVVAIGEVGLDYYYETSPRAKQKEVFEAQILLAEKLNLPLVLHLRDAFGDAFDIMRANASHLTKVLLHCYSGSKEMAKQFARFDPYFAFGGVITFPNANKAEVVNYVKDRVVFETDCPFMTPVPYRGKCNEPKYVPLVYQRASEITGEDVEALKERVRVNVRDLFGINVGETL